MESIKKVIIMAGGTGGHVFPGLAIAKAFQEKKIKVKWLGSVGGMETTLVPQHNIELHTLSIKGLRGKSLLSKLFFPIQLIQAVYQAYLYFKIEKPDLVLGMGGFVAGPGGIASKLCGIPLVIHEQNSIAGLTNRYLAKIAKKVLSAYPNTFPENKNAIVVGNPVRKEIENLHYANHKDNLQLFIIGGSRGAQALNEMLPKALSLLPESIRPSIDHQTGSAQEALTKINYEKHQLKANIHSFIDDIATKYANTDIIVGRAGALTLAEITAVGIPAILIPYPYAVDDHQTANAKYLENNDAAIVIQQSDLSAEKLSGVLLELLSNSEKRMNMSKASRNLRKEAATTKIIDICLSLS